MFINSPKPYIISAPGLVIFALFPIALLLGWLSSQSQKSSADMTMKQGEERWPHHVMLILNPEKPSPGLFQWISQLFTSQATARSGLHWQGPIAELLGGEADIKAKP